MEPRMNTLMDTDSKAVFGMPIAAEESELNLIDSAFKLLTSADEVVSAEALVSLKRTVSKRLKRTIFDDDLEEFLSGVS
ncbi:hypothetical protein CEXT_785881 [Caerostris extrusa]|uniref:Uncharacterized protein n=1 Tax=Caerostris extrusa TaxID=172846 RepID=A0AAV4TWB4_CAEEX|nr:hypothetical protein CEXT_785881 [Caerostris extrusa]